VTLETATYDDLLAILSGIREFVQRDSLPDLMCKAIRLSDVDEDTLRGILAHIVIYSPDGVTLDEVASVGA